VQMAISAHGMGCSFDEKPAHPMPDSSDDDVSGNDGGGCGGGRGVAAPKADSVQLHTDDPLAAITWAFQGSGMALSDSSRVIYQALVVEHSDAAEGDRTHDASSARPLPPAQHACDAVSQCLPQL